MKRHPRRVSFVAALTAAALATTLPPTLAPATAQDRGAPAPADAPDAAYFVVTADVDVRSGAADSYYPFGRLERGDVVKVVGEKHEWARVVTAGPAFDGLFAYVRFALTEADRLKLENGGRRGRTQGMTRVLAPNMNTGYDPNDSWKRILLLDGDRVVDVLETTDDGRLVVHKIALPPDAEGWVNTRFLAAATDAQIATWKTAVARGPRAPREKTATAPPAAAPAGTVLARDEPVVPAVSPPAFAPDEPLAPAVIEPAVIEPAPAYTGDDAIDVVVVEPALELTIDEGRAATAVEADLADAIETTPGPPGAADPLVAPPAPAIEPEKGRAAAAETPPRTPKERLEDLEAAYARLREEPIATAEVVPMRGLYLDLADASVDDDDVFRYAQARAEQLAIWADLQQRRVELSRLRQRLELTAEESRAVRLALETTGVYTAVGRLTASTIYDGSRLPRLLRIQEVSSGRTIAYVEPDAAFDYYPMLGQLIGVVGKKYKSAELGVNVVEPKRIDLLATSQAG